MAEVAVSCRKCKRVRELEFQGLCRPCLLDITKDLPVKNIDVIRIDEKALGVTLTYHPTVDHITMDFVVKDPKETEG